MSTSDETNGEDYGEAEINDRGRLTIPKSLRDELNIDGGTKFKVIKEGSEIRLVRVLPSLHTITRGEKWGEEAFLDAGESTFGGK